jgi:hypothetical protein
VKSLTEIARDLNAIKTERSHTRIVLPDDRQAEENYRFIASLLEGTGVDQQELAALSLATGSSAVQALSTVDGGLDAGELIAVFGSLWIDGVLLGLRFANQDRLYGSANGTRDAEAPEPSGAGNGTGSPGNPDADPSPDRTAAQDDPRGERDR